MHLIAILFVVVVLACSASLRARLRKKNVSVKTRPTPKPLNRALIMGLLAVVAWLVYRVIDPYPAQQTEPMVRTLTQPAPVVGGQAAPGREGDHRSTTPNHPEKPSLIAQPAADSKAESATGPAETLPTLPTTGATESYPPHEQGIRVVGLDSAAPAVTHSATPLRAGKIVPTATTTGEGCREWVAPYVRQDGTTAEGYWRKREGCVEVSPSSAQFQQEATASTLPASDVSTASPSYVGPRGGRYHYSKSGKKVYEHKK